MLLQSISFRYQQRPKIMGKLQNLMISKSRIVMCVLLKAWITDKGLAVWGDRYRLVN